MDTSSLVGAWVRSYPRDVFPGLWSELEDRVESGAVVSPEEVRNELEAKADDLYEWACTQSGLFVPLDGEQMNATQDVLAAYPRLVGELAERNKADPFVIALAQLKGLTVVTEERGGSEQRPRIPFVCQQLGVPCIGTLDFIRSLGLSF